MKVILFLVLLLFNPPEQRIVSGVILMDKSYVPGCKVELIENRVTQLTDSEGRFQFQVNELENATLLVSSTGVTCQIEIRNITFEKNKIDLGTIPIFMNETISITDYESLAQNQKDDYLPLYHEPKLVGYVNKNKVNTTDVHENLWKYRKIKYEVDSINNKIVVQFKDWNP